MSEPPSGTNTALDPPEFPPEDFPSDDDNSATQSSLNTEATSAPFVSPPSVGTGTGVAGAGGSAAQPPTAHDIPSSECLFEYSSSRIYTRHTLTLTHVR